MAYTEAQRDALETAIAGGVRRVSYDGKTVEYNSLDELRAALTEVKQGLASQAGGTINRQVKIVSSKGL